jgi:hypothetical protein
LRIPVILVAIAMAAAPAIAQRDAAVGVVRLKLDDLAEASGDPEAVDTVIGRLKMEEDAGHVFRLDPTKSYLVLAACEDLCSHLDLVAIDARTGAIFEDDDRDKGDEPSLEIAAGEISSLSIKVEMSGCEKSNACIYALGLYEQP